MTLTAFVKKLTGLESDKQTTALENYRKMVRLFAAGGEHIEAEEAAEILDAVGVSPERFQQDVQERIEVAELRATMATEAATGKALAKAYESLKKFDDDELERLEKSKNDRLAVLTKLFTLKATRDEISSARGRLGKLTSHEHNPDSMMVD